MEFRASTITEELPDKVGDNAKRLEEIVGAVNWPKLIRAVAFIHLGLLIILFTTIAVVRLAFHIF